MSILGLNNLKSFIGGRRRKTRKRRKSRRKRGGTKPSALPPHPPLERGQAYREGQFPIMPTKKRVLKRSKRHANEADEAAANKAVSAETQAMVENVKKLNLEAGLPANPFGKFSHKTNQGGRRRKSRKSKRRRKSRKSKRRRKRRKSRKSRRASRKRRGGSGCGGKKRRSRSKSHRRKSRRASRKRRGGSGCGGHKRRSRSKSRRRSRSRRRR